MDSALERKIISGTASEYAEYFSDGVGVVIKGAIRTMNEDYGQILSDGYESHATYFSNSADESKNYGGYKTNRTDYGGRTPRSVQADLLMKNPYIVYGNGRKWTELIDNNSFSEEEIKSYQDLEKAHAVISALSDIGRQYDTVEDIANTLKIGQDIDFYSEIEKNPHLSGARKIFNSVYEYITFF
jgi:hypothetical protein